MLFWTLSIRVSVPVGRVTVLCRAGWKMHSQDSFVLSNSA